MTKINYQDYTREQLINELKRLNKRRKYGLVWEQEKTKEIFDIESEGKLPIIIEDKEKEIINDKNDLTHILIEGDNYHSLSVLTYTHPKNIDLIYIDPPYNTGAQDWRYNNNFVDKEDAYRHSKWLSFIYNRLLLAKLLLKKDGIIVITIDDNELYHLGALLEQTFPFYEHFIITIEHNKRGRRGHNFAKTNEWAIFLIPQGMKLIAEEKTDSIIGGETRNLRRTGSGSKRIERPRKFYPIWVNKKTMKVVKAGDPIETIATWKNQEDGDLITVWPIDENGNEKNWHYGVERTRRCIDENKLEARYKDYGIQVYYTLREKDSKKYKTVWTGAKFDASTHGSVLLEAILGQSGKFDYPKSLYAVIECLKATVINRPNAIVLDFFAGSGTTGHAVMELNKIDGGKRQFILCTNNENNICQEVTYERIKNVMNGYEYEGNQRELLLEKKLSPSLFRNGRMQDFLDAINSTRELHTTNYDSLEENIEKDTYYIYGIDKTKNNKAGLGGNLKYYKTSFVGSEPTHRNKRILTEKSVEMLCIKENTFDIVLNKPDFSIYKNSSKYTAILLNEIKLDKFKQEIAKLNLPISVYVFSLEGDDFKEEFECFKNNITLCSIPEAILRVYRRIYEIAKPKKLK